MKGRHHRKQILLFLVAVLLPSMVLVFLTIRTIGQEKELSKKRLAEERVRKAREIGQHLLVNLENIKLQEINSAASRGSFSLHPDYANPEVVLIGAVEARRMELPWENRESLEIAKQRLKHPAFVQKIERGEGEEFMERNFSQAARFYSQALTAAEHLIQKEYARLLLARVLFKARREAESAKHYRILFALPIDIMDDFGTPLFLYGASRLLEIEADYAEILDRIQVETTDLRWIQPGTAHMLQDLLEKIRNSSSNTEDRKRSESHLEFVRLYLKLAERVKSLQENFLALGLPVKGNAVMTENRPLWAIFDDSWLVSLSPPMSDRPALLIVVDREKVLASLKRNEDFLESFPFDFKVVAEDDPEGLSVGSNIRGVKILFSEDQEIGFVKPWIVQPAFYLIALLLILGITLFGAYILWRDIRRDVRMAEMRSQFVSSVSHELKTPLTSIRMFAETLRLGRSKDKKAQEEYLDTIVNESQRLTRLLNNVLDFSKIEQGKRTYRPEPTSLENIFQSVARTMEYPLSQQGFTIDVKIENNIPDVRVDRDAMEQALLNLLHNAMKYSGDSREIGLRLKKRDGYALIQVIDHGIGISPQEQKKIFEKFYRAATPENERIAGTGLGLALVSHIVESHGGRLELESEPGKGSAFSILLPLEETQ
jgi:signal transduction histidine kinase